MDTDNLSGKNGANAVLPLSEVFCGDCMVIMAQYPDKYFDLAVVDPPYKINAGNMQMGSAPNRKGKGQYPGESTAVKLKKDRLNHGCGKLKNRALNTMDCDWDREELPKDYFKELFRVSKNQIIWGMKQIDIACRFKITQQTVSKIVNNKSWR
jgi:site-specific DNA-methyltransferase (adenine-specific)